MFDNNSYWGISAWRIDMTSGSKLTATNNGYSGVWTRVLNLDSTCTLDVESNGAKAPSTSNNAGITFMGNGTYKSNIENGAKVTITNNAGSGILTKQKACNLTIGSATITNNGTGSINQGNIGAEFGGGINNVGTVVLDPSVQIYNNHASKAGDDLYSTGAGTTSFGDTGSSWILDDCNEAIDGWYTDEGCTEKWVDYTPLAGSMTLYGKWTKDPTPEPSTPTEPSQPGSQTSTDSNAQPQQASSTENLAQTGDATLPFGLAVAGIALAAGAVALISRRLLKH